MAKTEKDIALTTQSLAVKYRPRHVSDLIGQPEVVSKLQGIIKSRKLPSAFLLIGGTGRGKTTTARIIAKHLNCEDLSGCGKCKNCIANDAYAHPDFQELNIADSRGIDDLRSIISMARNRPRMGRLRVILLDEVHQLTPQAAEVLLKPLEEPPPNTLWLLATTDPEKLKQTIVKRCMVLHLLAIKEQDIISRLEFISKKERIKIKDKVLAKIASASGGHMRNAIALLENVDAAKAGGMEKTSQLLKLIEQDSQESTDKDLEALTIDLLVASLALSLKTFWKLVGSRMAQGEEVAMVNKALFFIQHIIEEGTAGKGPMIWHTPSNVRFRRSLTASIKGWDVSQYTYLQRATSLLDKLSLIRNEIVTSSGSSRTLLTSRLGVWIANQKRLEKLSSSQE